MRVRVTNGRGEDDWRDLGPHGHGYRHHWDRERRTIDEQLAAAFPVQRLARLPQVTVSLERAA